VSEFEAQSLLRLAVLLPELDKRYHHLRACAERYDLKGTAVTEADACEIELAINDLETVTAMLLPEPLGDATESESEQFEGDQ